METELLGMTATDELREMLDERGIEYEQSRIEGIAEYTHVTKWKTQTGNKSTFYEIEDGYPPHFTRMFIEAPTAEQAIDATVGPQITEDTSDGWHSFKDLYHHRALLFSVIVHNYRDMCWKSKKHHDGKELDWNFIVGIDTPWGQASYHYGMEYWDLFDCKELEQAPYYDGYTADESVARIARLRELDSGRGTCEAVAMDCAGNAPYHTCECQKLREENAKLRELVQEAVDAASLKDMRDWSYGKRLVFLREARELGIEVDG